MSNGIFENEWIEPSFQFRKYRTKDVVRIVDRYQEFKYLSLGLKPVDMYVSNDNLVMVFLKNETQDAYEKYRKREL